MHNPTYDTIDDQAELSQQVKNFVEDNTVNGMEAKEVTDAALRIWKPKYPRTFAAKIGRHLDRFRKGDYLDIEGRNIRLTLAKQESDGQFHPFVPSKEDTPDLLNAHVLWTNIRRLLCWMPTSQHQALARELHAVAETLEAKR